MYSTYTIKYYSAIKKNECISFVGKGHGTEDHHAKQNNPVSEKQA
jgi:hypothetical protein